MLSRRRVDRIIGALQPAATRDTELAPRDRLAEILGTPRTRRRFWRPSIGLTAALATAATVVAVTIPFTRLGEVAVGPDGHRPTPADNRTVEPVDPKAFLLASADRVAALPIQDGTYWHVKERRCEPVMPIFSKRPDPVGRHLLLVHGTGCTTEDTWKGKTGFYRAVVGQDPKITFASARDEATWRTIGMPMLVPKLGWTENDDPAVAAHSSWGAPFNSRLSLTQLRALPTLPERLSPLFSSAFSSGGPSIPQLPALDSFIWGSVPEFLSQPITPATRAAFYRLLATIPGIRTASVSRTPDGLSVITIAYPTPTPIKEKLGLSETTLTFLQESGTYLGSQTGPGVQSQLLTAEWTAAPGDRQGPRTDG